MRQYLNNKPRSRRLRKKLHLGEFQELGFHVQLSFTAELDLRAKLLFLDNFLDFLDKRQFGFAGSETGGLVCASPLHPLTPEAVAEIVGWLSTGPNVLLVWHGKLFDLWYDDEESFAPNTSLFIE